MQFVQKIEQWMLQVYIGNMKLTLYLLLIAFQLFDRPDCSRFSLPFCFPVFSNAHNLGEYIYHTIRIIG